MRKTLKVFLLLLFLKAATVFAASSGSIMISGIVPLINDISIVPFGSNNTSLDITGGETNKKVAIFSLTSNNLNGYKIQAKSTNGAKLLHGASSNFVSYTVKFGSFSSATPTTTYADIGTASGALVNKTTTTGDITVSVTGDANALAGTYSDEVFFQVVAL